MSASARHRPPAGNLVHEDLPLSTRVLRDELRPEVRRVLVDSPTELARMHRVHALVHARIHRSHRTAPGAAPDLRPAWRRGGDQPRAGCARAVEVRRLHRDPADRGDDHGGREHRRLCRPSQSRGDDLPHQPGGGGHHRAPAARAQPRRHHPHRLHRHGGRGSSPGAAGRAAGGAGHRPVADAYRQHLAAGADRDDAQAHAREPGAPAVRAVPAMPGTGLRAHARDGEP